MIADFRDKAEFDGVEALAETELAVKVRFDDGRIEWIPQSHIHDDSEVWKAGQKGTLVVSEWIATEKRLI